MLEGSVWTEYGICEKKALWVAKLKLMVDDIYIGVESADAYKGNKGGRMCLSIDDVSPGDVPIEEVFYVLILLPLRKPLYIFWYFQ